MAVCFEKKFLFDQKGNFKNVEIEAKNGDLGLWNGHGSKRSLFVTEDLAEEDEELQRTIMKETFDTDVLSLSGLEELNPGGHSITKHTGEEGLARRSESKTPKYLSKIAIFKKC